jgi:superfamily II DNA or RNA helicase
MTEPRRRLLADAFAPAAVRVGLTATPDYDADRRLARFFPDLIHEVTLGEALDLGLLAPARAWVAEVDASSSVVRLTAGDFDPEALGRIMSAAPFFQAAAAFRYAGANAGKGALLCCATRQQAHDIVGPRFEGLLRDIFHGSKLPDDFSLYLHIPTATDPALLEARQRQQGAARARVTERLREGPRLVQEVEAAEYARTLTGIGSA